MDKEVPTGESQPCPKCLGSGYQALGCNLFPCPGCKGTGIGKGVQEEKGLSSLSTEGPEF